MAKNGIYVEPGSFTSYGGWVLDTEFIPNIGTAYLLAHGLGHPVSGAKTEVTIPKAGMYHVWVFTKDWNAQWKPGYAPGRFKVHINQECAGTFGDKTVEWKWQRGTSLFLPAGKTEITLEDLTGFEGRCGGIFLCEEAAFEPPSELSDFVAFKREQLGWETETDVGTYELVVLGGGIAGICTAVSAAREGVSVALVCDRMVLGGNNSSEVHVALGGMTNCEPYPNLGNIVLEMDQENPTLYETPFGDGATEDARKLALVQKEKNITLFLGHAVTDAETEGDSVTSAVLYDVKSGEYKRIYGSLFADCTGDGVLAYAAGADFEVTTNGHMGMTNLWKVADTGVKQTFPRCPWAMDLSQVDFPGRKEVKSVYGEVGEKAFGGWYWESGMEHDPIAEAEYARDTNFRAMYGAWDCVKNVDGDYKTYQLESACYIGGKRESRRFFGDVVLTKSDVFKGVEYPDRFIPSWWNFDVHYPDRRFYAAFAEGDAFLTKDYHEDFHRPFHVPYRILYSRNVKNLFLAGRNVSVSHDALGTVRVMRTCGMMGEVVGKAAKICVEHHAFPRDVYECFLEELKTLVARG